MKLETLIDAARKSGFMHHCTGIQFDAIDSKRWAATLYDREGRSHPHGTGATIEEAVAAVVSKVSKWVQDRRDRALREEQESQSLLEELKRVGMKEATDATT